MRCAAVTQKSLQALAQGRIKAGEVARSQENSVPVTLATVIKPTVQIGTRTGLPSGAASLRAQLTRTARGQDQVIRISPIPGGRETGSVPREVTKPGTQH